MKNFTSFILSGLGLVVAQDITVATPSKGSGPLTSIPILGLGTWQVQGSANATEIVADAIEQGYRHIDCAYIYGNQRAVGLGLKEGLRRTGLQRSDLWITSKLWNANHGNADAAIKDTLTQLGLDYLDLYLIHWPMGRGSSFDHVETWKRMEKVVRPTQGTRYIGVSNHSPQQLTDILAIATVPVKAHQFELHPYLQQSDFISTHFKNNITVIAYSPLGNTNPTYGALNNRQVRLLRNPLIQEIATARGCTTAQVSLAWNMKRNVVVIPKAANQGHRKENIETVAKCALKDEDMARIKGLGITLRLSASVCTNAVEEPSECFKGLEGM